MTHTTTQTSKTITTKLPQSVQRILNNYDINDLLTRTIPKDYHISDRGLEIYKKTTKFDTLTTIELNDEAVSKLKSFADNYPNYKQSEVLSYLIDMVCDLSKIHTKDISEALQTYYEIASSDPDRHIKILNAYADSLYYQDPHTDSETGITIGGLDEESLAYFLISSERTRIIKIKNQDRNPYRLQSFFILFYYIISGGSPSTLFFNNSYPNFLPASPPIIL